MVEFRVEYYAHIIVIARLGRETDEGQAEISLLVGILCRNLVRSYRKHQI